MPLPSSLDPLLLLGHGGGRGLDVHHRGRHGRDRLDHRGFVEADLPAAAQGPVDLDQAQRDVARATASLSCGSPGSSRSRTPGSGRI